ncbi:protein crumbs homolog 2 isoform X2 [Lissotriton helveticus]
MDRPGVLSTRRHRTVLFVPLSLLVWGSVCSQVASNCSSAPCQHGATCEDFRDGYTCTCPREPLEYTGRNCELLYDECSTVACPNNETCTSTLGTRGHQCICPRGAPDTNCSTTTRECKCAQPNSVCEASATGLICQCQRGFFVEECQAESSQCVDNPCQNNGTCFQGVGNYTCACAPGFRGFHCEEDIDECASSPCQNGAICLDRANEYNCFCVPGFQGNHCEIDINECASRPCINNGTCLNMMDHYECKCTLGYTGINCEIDINECQSDPCQNNATCNDHVGFYTCTCVPGYQGEHCEVDIDECASQPCENGGRCLDRVNRYECDCCDTGFTGDHCELDIPECASDPCLNNAICLEGVKNYSCACWPGYTGYHCAIDIDECADGPCENGALCFERSNQTNYGLLPELQAEFSYLEAEGYICQCLPGFTGENCSVNIDECESQPCQNGGRCEDAINKYLCHCALGYTGVECATNIDDCESDPCENGALCEDGIADYTCLCPSADDEGVLWGGKNCSVRLTGCQQHLCQNEATCLPTYEEGNHGYLCQCNVGFYDDVCSTSTTFSFSSFGYVIYELPSKNRTKREVVSEGLSISLRFRTTLPNLLLFYQGDEVEFLFLEIHKGLLQAMIMCNGAETYLKMNELRVDDGQWHQAEVTLKEVMRLTISHEGCSNGTCMKDQSVSSNRSIPDSFNRMYIGGLYEGSFLNNTMSQQNFTGCMEDLRINSRTLLPHNLTGDTSYQLSLGCNRTEWCRPNPCFNGGSCIDLWTSFRCECMRPYEGATCLQEYIPGTFNLDGRPSHVTFSIGENFGTNFSFSVFLRTLKPSGLLLQVGNDSTSVLSVYLENGRICIFTSAGNNVTFPEIVADGRRHLLGIHFRGGMVAVSNQGRQQDLGQLDSVALDSVALAAGYHVYVGGLPDEERLELWGGYFKGCLQDLRLNNHRMEFFPLQMENYTISGQRYVGKVSHVTESCVSDDTCKSEPCKNGGACTVTWNDFSCRCTSKYTGPTCEELVWCEITPCPTATECLNVPGGYMCLANATFQGSSVLEYTTKTSIGKDLTSIALRFRTRDKDAILLHAARGVDSLMIGIENNFLLVNILSGNSIEGISFKSETPVSDALWHHLVLSMEEDTAAFSSEWVARLDSTRNLSLQGSAGNLNFLQNKVSIFLAENFTGCLGHVSIGGIHLPFVEDHSFPQLDQFVKRSPGVVPLGCRGADVCLVNPCSHHGKCQDLFNSFSCVCTPAWEGPQCESNVNDCKSNPCPQGSCIDLEGDYRCVCSPGYTGRNCEVDVDDCQHHQCLNGGTCIDGMNTYSCKCTSAFAGTYCQWPYPPDQCDKNFTCLNEGKCTSGIWGANCTCKAGFTGRNCEVNIDECNSSPCLNGGTCQDSINKYKCICNGSFTGSRCENPVLRPSTQISAFVGSAAGAAILLILFAVITTSMVAMRKKRATQGTYSPSRQEKDGARVEMWNVLKLPPNERLI